MLTLLEQWRLQVFTFKHGKIQHTLHELGKTSSSFRQAANMLKGEDYPVVAQSLFNLALVCTKVNKLDDAL